jgi:hypothetical protein
MGLPIDDDGIKPISKKLSMAIILLCLVIVIASCVTLALIINSVNPEPALKLMHEAPRLVTPIMNGTGGVPSGLAP